VLGARTSAAGRFVSDAPSSSLSESDDESLDESEEELLEEDDRGRDVAGTFGASGRLRAGSASLSSDESEEELLEEDERGRDVAGTVGAVCPVGAGSASLSSDESEEELLEEDERGRDVASLLLFAAQSLTNEDSMLCPTLLHPTISALRSQNHTWTHSPRSLALPGRRPPRDAGGGWTVEGAFPSTHPAGAAHQIVVTRRTYLDTSVITIYPVHIHHTTTRIYTRSYSM